MNVNIFSPDERLASWKILLPHGKGYEVLVIGDEKGIVKSLSRSYDSIDWISPISSEESVIFEHSDTEPKCSSRIRLLNNSCKYDKQYDVIVISSSQKKTGEFIHVIKLLKTDGVLIFIGLGNKIIGEKRLSCYNFDNVQYYAALPFKNPRLFFPLSNKKFRQKCLMFHTPGSIKAQYALKLLRSMSDFGITLPLCQHGILVAGKNSLAGRDDTLCSWINSKLSVSIENIAIYCGSDLPKRKITILAEAWSHGKLIDYVIKIADTQEGRKSVNHESNVLRALAKSNFVYGVPELLFADTWNGYGVQVQSSLPFSCAKQIMELKEQHIIFLKKISLLNRDTKILKETADWKALMSAYKSDISKKLPSHVHNIIRMLVDKKMSDVECPIHRTHGDFAPWNINVIDGKLHVFDWEESREDGLAYTDLFYFIYRQASFVGPWIGADAILLMLHEKSRLMRDMIALSDDAFSAVIAVLMVQEFIRRPHIHIVELIETYYKRLNG